MPLQQPSLEVGTEVSRYRVEELVARGGMGLVYRARDVRLDRQVALKVLSPELSDDEGFRERFVRESRLTAAVDHPHVIPVYEADEWHGLLYIAMRFVRGVDLHTVLATSGPMDAAVAVPLLTQAADALDAAHEIGLVHRDVKPGNFMLAGAQADRVPPGAHVYLTDFGLTKRATSVSGLTRTGQFLGSLHYVAPEQVRGEDVDARTDVYALACVAFEMFSGRPPFRHDQDAALLWAHMSVPPPPLTDDRPDLPDELDDVLAAGLAKDAAGRPDSCGDLIRSVRAALGGPPTLDLPDRRGTTAPIGTPRPPAARPPREDSAPPTAVPSVPPVGVAYTTVQQRQDTPVAAGPPPGATGPPPGAGGPLPWGGGSYSGQGPAGGYAGPGYGGPPPGGPPVGGWEVAPAEPPPAAPPGRRRPRRWLVAAIALVVVLAVALVVWRPWAGPDLVTRDFVVVPFQADVPAEWEEFAVSGDSPYMVLGPRDWTGLVADDSEAVAAAETALTEDPDSLVHLYVDPAFTVYASDPQGLADAVQAEMEGSTIVGRGTREVDGREAFTAGGVGPLGEGQLRVYAVTIQDEPRLFMLFVAPIALYDQWEPTFDAIVDSVTFTG
jgi:hypothetical protein